MPPCDPPVNRTWPSSRDEERQRISNDDRPAYDSDKKKERRLRRWAARDEWRRKIAAPGAWIFAAVAVTEAIGLGLQAANVPALWWGDRNDKTVLDYAVAVGAALGVLLSAVLASAYARLARARTTDRRLEELARSIAREVRQLSGLAVEDVSVHVWELKNPRIGGIPRWVPRRPHAQHLVRRAAYVPERREHEAIAFMEGFGVVGRCWERRRELVEDLSKILTAATDAEAYYGSFGYKERFRLSFAQLWNTRTFWAIWAYPIFVGPPAAKKFGGCVSVDAQCPGHADKLQSVADNRSQELDSLFADCAALLRGELPVA